MAWPLAGALVGALAALLAFAPASWLAQSVADATDGRLQLADARGTVWSGSAAVVLTGGPGSRDASALPGRLQWSLSPAGTGLAIYARHDCCLNGELQLRLRPRLSGLRIELVPGTAAIGQWPAAWLVGLGTPWNTLRPTGSMLLRSPGLAIDRVQGHWIIDGAAELELSSMGSRVSTLDVLGSYLVRVHGEPAAGGARMELSTVQGALQLSGSGNWAGSRLRFSGQAQAGPGAEAALNNLLNIIGRRQGALSVITIG